MNTTAAAIAASDAGANPQWKATALEVVKDIAARKANFTTDEVWAELEKRGVSTHDNRAMGPVMLRAKKEGMAEILTCGTCGTNKVMVASMRPEAHAMDIAVYRSLIKE